MAVTTPNPLAEVRLRTQMFTGGRFVDAVSGRTYEVENPANGQTIAEVAEGGVEDVDRAVEAARRAAPGWAATSPADRKKVLQRFADLIDANSEELARIETLDVGKPISDTRSLDIPDSAATIRWHAEATDKLYDQVAPTGPGAVAMVVREPLGVVGAIVPWNYPLQMAAWKLRTILEHSAQSNLKRVALELGGKSPQIVMADAANLDRVADRVANAIFWNMGENCSAGSRLLVDRRVKGPLLDRLVGLVERDWIVGDPMDDTTRVGPLITKSHMEKVLGYIDAGRAEGARAVVGGGRVREDSGGWFVAPTIFDRATNQMTIAREEIFGPVLSVIEFEGEDEAIAIANDTDYGLAASLYTENVRTAHRMARAIKAGVVGVNNYSEGDLTTPFGGFRQSGFGGHDKSVHAHDQYTNLKTIWIDMGE